MTNFIWLIVGIGGASIIIASVIIIICLLVHLQKNNEELHKQNKEMQSTLDMIKNYMPTLNMIKSYMPMFRLYHEINSESITVVSKSLSTINETLSMLHEEAITQKETHARLIEGQTAILQNIASTSKSLKTIEGTSSMLCENAIQQEKAHTSIIKGQITMIQNMERLIQIYSRAIIEPETDPTPTDDDSEEDFGQVNYFGSAGR